MGDKRVVVCGLTHLGYWVASLLHQAGVTVTVVDDAPDRALARRLIGRGVTVVEESPRSSDVLTGAGVDAATALIACAEADLHNLEIVLLAHAIAPELTLVAKIANAPLARELADGVPTVRTLSPAHLCARPLVEDCGDDRILHSVPGTALRVTEVAALAATSVGVLAGAHEAVALRREHAVETELAPDRATRIAAGDVVSTLSRATEEPASYLTRPAGWLSRRWRSGRRLAAALAADLDRPVRLVLLAVAGLIVVSTLVLAPLYDNQSVVDPATGQPRQFSLLDALYLTVTVITTVGFGDFAFGGQSPGLKLFGVGLIVLGATTMTLLYAYLTNFLVSRRMSEVVGRRQRVDLSGHVVVCGLGSVGIAVLEELLRRGERAAVIETDPTNRFLDAARALRVPVLLGDVREAATLRRANVGSARAVAVLTTDDQVNLECALTVRAEYARGHPGERIRVVLRLFDEELAARIEDTFDIHRARSVSALAAPHFVGTALGLEILSTFPVGRQPVLVTVAEPGVAGSGLVAVADGGRSYLVGALADQLRARRR